MTPTVIYAVGALVPALAADHRQMDLEKEILDGPGVVCRGSLAPVRLVLYCELAKNLSGFEALRERIDCEFLSRALAEAEDHHAAILRPKTASLLHECSEY